jgi:hypothetical protein
MRRTHAGFAAGAMAAVALTAGSVAAGRGEVARHHDTPNCTLRQLVVWLNINGNAAAGTSYYGLELTNLSARSCMMRGYPTVSAIDVGGRQLGDASVRRPLVPTRGVVLASGDTATALLQIADTDVYPPASCLPVTAAGLRVSPPGNGGAKIVPFVFRACSRRGRAYMHVAAAAERHESVRQSPASR